MFDEMEALDQVYSQSSDDDGQGQPLPPLRRKKTINQQLAFFGTNLLAMPIIALCYLTINAEGLRQMMSIFAMRIYKLPVPGAGLLRQWDGWNRIDLSMVMAMLLFMAVTYIWFRVFTELMGEGTFIENRTRNPALFYLLTTIVGILLAGDCLIFFFGLESKAASSWDGTPGYVPAFATILYMAGLALIGFWHADYHKSGIV